MVKINSSGIPLVNSTVVIGGSTTFSTLGYGSTNVASTIMQRDSSNNCQVNNIIETTDQIVSAGQTVAMTAASGATQQISGTATVTFRLPTATTLPLGTSFTFNNNSTQSITVNRQNNTLVCTVLPSGYVQVNCTDNSTGPGVWDYNPFLASGSTSGSNGTTVAGFLSANTIIPGYTTTATAAGTTTLTVLSTQQQYFTGTTTQTVVLPVTSTLVLGQPYTIVNNSTGIVTVQSSGGNTIESMAANTILTVSCILTSGTTAASWSAQYSLSTPGTTVIAIKSIAFAASPYTALITDQFLACQSSGGAITIRLPNAPATGRTFIIKDASGAAAASNISVTTVGGTVTLDGQTTYTMSTNYQSINVIYDGANYEIF